MIQSEKNIKRKNESEIKIDVQNQPKFAKIHKLDVLFAKDKINAKSHDEHDVTDETIEKILPILEINEHDLDLNGNDSSYKLGINYIFSQPDFLTIDATERPR